MGVMAILKSGKPFMEKIKAIFKLTGERSALLLLQ
jgi:hypothetical protein